MNRKIVRVVVALIIVAMVGSTLAAAIVLL